ncbi:MAG: MFS transporter [Pirellula sp.]
MHSTKSSAGKSSADQSLGRPLGKVEVLAFACSLSMITYLDRVCFGAAMPYIVKDLGLTGVSDLKWALTAFAFAYAAFEMPSGWLGDAFGPRRTLIRIVIGWSIFTALTGLVGIRVGGVVFGGIGLLCLIRFLFGIGEAGAFPNLARVVANWFPPQERGRAKGWIWMSGRFMGGATPLIWVLLVAGTPYTRHLLSWRGAFVLFGFLGILWCIAFSRRFTDRPAVSTLNDEHRGDALKQEPNKIHAFPWKVLLTRRSSWMIGLMYWCASYSWYFNITYFPSYMETSHGVASNDILGSILKGGPLLLGGVGCLIGGYWTDYLMHKHQRRRWARRIPAMIGHASCGLCYVFAFYASSAWTAALAISLAAFSNDLMMGAAWATCQDIGRRHTAVVAGWMNMIGNLGGAFSGWAIGTILESFVAARAVLEKVDVKELAKPSIQEATANGYRYALLTFVLVSFVAIFTWLFIDADKPLEADG